MNIPHSTYRRNLKIAQVLLIILTPSVTLTVMVTLMTIYVDYKLDLTYTLSSLLSDFLRFFFVFEFLLVCTIVRLRFKLLNQNLRRLMKKDKNHNVDSTEMNSKIGLIFSNLCDAINQINGYSAFVFVLQYTYMVVRTS